MCVVLVWILPVIRKKLKTAKLGIDATRPFDKRKEGFEIAKIPKLDKISLDNY